MGWLGSLTAMSANDIWTVGSYNSSDGMVGSPALMKPKKQSMEAA